MAFVFKSKRKTTLGQNECTELGPGQYLSSESLILKNKPKSSKAPPFLTSQNRNTELSNKHNIPGPGTYQLREESDIKPIISKKTETLYNNFEIEDPTLAKKLGFLMKDKRFHNEIKDEVPGPGQYENNPKANKMRKVKSSVNRRAFRPLTSIRDAQPSVAIPSKNKCFGFDVLEDGTIKLAEDPLKFIKYEGEKFDSVGPGAYELSDKKNWNRGGTAWSKFKTKRNIIDNKDVKDKKLNYSYEDKNMDTLKVLEKRKLEKEQLSRFMKEKTMMRRQLVEAYNNEQMEDIDRVIKNETPGPGYYEYGKLYSTAREYKVREYYQFFGSICERFNLPNSNAENLGPGSYFNITNNTKQKKRPKSKAPFNSRSERNILSLNSEPVPGPGKYNPEKISKKNNNSLKMIFASSTKRDVNFIKSNIENPGPGSYIEVKSDLNQEDHKIKYKYSAPFKSSKRISEFEKKDNNPPVGIYNPNIANDIYYINGKKAFRPSLVNVPFSSLKKRFEDKLAETVVGPGQYFREISENKSKEISVPFKAREKRFKCLEKKEEFAPVGTYNLSSHFDWNKKTFNINFL